MKRSLAVSVAVIAGVGLGVTQAPAPPATGAVVALADPVLDTLPVPASTMENAPLAPSGPATASSAPATAMAPQPAPAYVGPAPAPGPGPDPDIIAVESPLDQAMLDTLVHSGRIRFDLPDGASLALIVDSVDERRGHQRIRVRSTSGNGQFTRAQWGFFGTVATDRGVYTFENQGIKTYIVKHSELDRRSLPGLSDAKRPRDA